MGSSANRKRLLRSIDNVRKGKYKKQKKDTNFGLSIKELDKLEKEIVEDFENGKLVKVKDEKKMMKQLLEAAKNYSKKNKSITLRVNERTLRKVKAKALEEGIPY